MKKFFKAFTLKRSLCLLVAMVTLLSVTLTACDKEKPKTETTAGTTTVNTENFVFPENFIIGTVNVSGKTYEEAFEAVEAGVIVSIKSFDIKIEADGKEFDYKDTDFQWDFSVEEAMLEAVKYAQSEDYKNDMTMGDPNSVHYEADVSFAVKEESVNAVVEAVAKAVDTKAVDSAISLVDGEIQISQEKSGKALDKADLTDKILVELPVLAISGNKEPKVIKAVVSEVKPAYNFESLDGEIKLLSTYSTYSENTADGNHNMALALSACDGSVINPGEVWSFNACTGDSNLESLGYRGATVIMNGEFVQGIGGGICQASSTIYNAALLANMDVEERYCHAYQSSYVPAGRDATIDYPNLDLKLSNPTDYPMYMQCYMEGVTLTVNIYGWDDPSFDTIEVESYVHSADKYSYRASAERVYYLDGEEVGREELPSSWYDYPDSDRDEPEETKPKATKPAQKPATKPATKPQTTKPQATKPQATVAPATKPAVTNPPVTQEPTEPVEITTLPPVTEEVPKETSANVEQIPTATSNY